MGVAPSGCGTEISRFLARCSQNDLFTLAFDATGARSGSVSSGGFLEVRFLDLARCSQSNLSTVVFDAPGARSGSVSSRWASGGEISRCGEVLSK